MRDELVVCYVVFLAHITASYFPLSLNYDTF